MAKISDTLRADLTKDLGMAWDDLTFGPQNHVETDLREADGFDKGDELDRLVNQAADAIEAVRVARRTLDTTVDDLFDLQRRAHDATNARTNFVVDECLRLGVGNIVSREDVDFTPVDGFGHMPTMIANMNTAVGPEMAEVAARMGASAATTQDVKGNALEETARRLREAHPLYETAKTLPPTATVAELREFMFQTGLPMAIIAEKDGTFIGMVRRENIPEEATGLRSWVEGKFGIAIPRFRSVSEASRVTKLMEKNLPVLEYDEQLRVDANEYTDRGDNPHPLIKRAANQALDLMETNNVEMLPVLRKGKIAGMLTYKGTAYSLRYRPHMNHIVGNEGLAFVGTVGAKGEHAIKRAKTLVELGASSIVVDTAHFDQGVETLATLGAIREAVGPDIHIVAGNVIAARYSDEKNSRSAVRAILTYANVVKIGVAPGWACTTNLNAANGAIQATAVMHAGREAADIGGFVMSDGGLGFHPRGAVLSHGMVGVSSCMYASKLSTTWQSPSPFVVGEDGHVYVMHSGMASAESAKARMNDRTSRFRRIIGPREEGATVKRRLPKDPRFLDVRFHLHYEMDGLTSSMTYAGSRSLSEFQKRSYVTRLTPNARGQGGAGY